MQVAEYMLAPLLITLFAIFVAWPPVSWWEDLRAKRIKQPRYPKFEAAEAEEIRTTQETLRKLWEIGR